MARGLTSISIDNFSGGWNLINDEVELNESPDLYNVTINQMGAVEKRLGYTKWNTVGQPGSLIKIGYWSDLLQKTIWQADVFLYDQSGSGTFGAASHTFTSTDRCAIVDFTNFVYAVHPLDGLIRSSDGITWAAVAGGPVGNTIAVWQNKLWVAGDPTNPERLYWSNPGDGGTWTGTDRVDIRAKDAQDITALHVAAREGLLVYKAESAYRVYDSSTGAYQVLDWNFGASNHQAVTSMSGQTMAICKHGVFTTDGMTVPQELSRKINKLFKEDVLDFSEEAKWCAGFRDPKVYFSLTTADNNGVNDLALEFDTRFAAWVPHSTAMASYVMYSPSDGEKLLGASPTANGQAYQLYTNVGTDDGTAITSRFQTANYIPERFGPCRFRHLLIRGRGTFTVHTRLSGGIDEVDSFNVDMSPAAGAVWDSATWDSATWGSQQLLATDQLFELGVGRDISFEIRESSSTSFTGTQILDNLGLAAKGAWALYGLKLDYVDLEGAV